MHYPKTAALALMAVAATMAPVAIAPPSARLRECGSASKSWCVTLHPLQSQATPSSCRSADIESRAFDWSAVQGLAGRYRLMLFETAARSPLVTFDLLFEATDSVHRYPPRQVGFLPGERPLVGHADQSRSNKFGLSAPTLPVAMIDSTLYVGEFNGLDGASFGLRIRRTSAGGFSGTWEWDGGIVAIVDSRTGKEAKYFGMFCAVRRA